MKIKETKIETVLWIGFLTIIAGFIIGMLTSCSAHQKSWDQTEKELCTPQNNTIKITWCDEQKVSYVDKLGHEGWFKNHEKEAFFVGDIYFKKFYN